MCLQLFFGYFKNLFDYFFTEFDSVHIACSSLTNSELVVPVLKNGKTVAVIDLDSNLPSNFTEDDVQALEEVASIISRLF